MAVISNPNRVKAAKQPVKRIPDKNRHRLANAHSAKLPIAE